MVTPHLHHMIPWDDLKELLRQRDPTVVHCPVGKACGKIHVDGNKQIQQIVSRRKFIVSELMVCQDPNCKEVLDLPQAFGKKSRKTLPPVVMSHSWSHHQNSRQLKTATERHHLRRFAETMSNTIKTFAKQEEDKISSRDYWKTIPKKATDEYVTECVHALRLGVDDKGYEKEFALMAHGEKDDLAILLYLDQQGKLNWRDALSANYHGQFVGNGVEYLLSQLMRFYFSVNAIAAAGYLTEPSQWGRLAEDSPDRLWWEQDYDFYSFVPAWREQLGGLFGPESRCIKDWPATMDVLRKTFRFFVVCEVLFQRHCKIQENEQYITSMNKRRACTFSGPNLARSLCDDVGLRPGSMLEYSDGELNFSQEAQEGTNI